MGRLILSDQNQVSCSLLLSILCLSYPGKPWSNYLAVLKLPLRLRLRLRPTLMKPLHRLEAKPHRSLKEWIKAFNTYDDEEDEDLSQHKLKRQSDPDAPDNILSEDGAAAEKRRETTRRSQDGSYYDEFDLDVDDDIFDSLIILVLAATLIVLVYVRQRRGLRGLGQGDGNAGGGGAGAGNGAGQPANNPAGPGGAAAGAQQQEDRGLFPQPGDPDFAAWVAGGVGH